jgi:2-methylcitrate dehydratase PrpD
MTMVDEQRMQVLELAEWVRTTHGPTGEDMRRLELLVKDWAAACVAGRDLDVSRIVAEHVERTYRPGGATILATSVETGVIGAALANGVLGNALDYDDGHRITRGHPGAVVISAALAAAEATRANYGAFLDAVAIGYEVAVWAGELLHEQSGGHHHASGAWGAVGAAAAAGRLFGLDRQQLAYALAIAEFYAPMSPIMRSVRDPAMTKDGTGWGALVGVSSVLDARLGVTSATPSLSEQLPMSQLSAPWRFTECYVKAYPCCRWAHPALAACDQLRPQIPYPSQIEQVTVKSFASAGKLAQRPTPTTTEEAQYSLVWPVACLLTRGRFEVSDVKPDAFADEATRSMAAKVSFALEPEYEAVYPGERLASVSVQFRDGKQITSGPCRAPGDPEDPAWEDIVAAKYEGARASLLHGGLGNSALLKLFDLLDATTTDERGAAMRDSPVGEGIPLQRIVLIGGAEPIVA